MKRNKMNFNVYYMVKYINGPKKGQIEDGNCIISQEYKNETKIFSAPFAENMLKK